MFDTLLSDKVEKEKHNPLFYLGHPTIPRRIPKAIR